MIRGDKVFFLSLPGKIFEYRFLYIDYEREHFTVKIHRPEGAEWFAPPHRIFSTREAAERAAKGGT
jgi:hypothetical protein